MFFNINENMLIQITIDTFIVPFVFYCAAGVHYDRYDFIRNTKKHQIQIYTVQPFLGHE